MSALGQKRTVGLAPTDHCTLRGALSEDLAVLQSLFSLGLCTVAQRRGGGGVDQPCLIKGGRDAGDGLGRGLLAGRLRCRASYSV